MAVPTHTQQGRSIPHGLTYYFTLGELHTAECASFMCREAGASVLRRKENRQPQKPQRQSAAPRRSRWTQVGKALVSRQTSRGALVHVSAGSQCTSIPVSLSLLLDHELRRAHMEVYLTSYSSCHAKKKKKTAKNHSLFEVTLEHIQCSIHQCFLRKFESVIFNL